MAITNIRTSTETDSPSPFDDKLSRGLIPFELLKQPELDPLKWKKIIQSFDCKNFNLLFGDSNKFYFYSSKTTELIKISDKIFSLANDGINSNWFKEERGKELISKLDESNFTESSLFNILTDKLIVLPAEDIKITNDKDHIEEDYKKWPIFVKPFKSRGTISSSVVLFKNNNVFRENTSHKR